MAKIKLGCHKYGGCAQSNATKNEIYLEWRTPLTNGLFNQISYIKDTRTKKKSYVPFILLISHLLSHETLHLTINKIEGNKTSRQLDNIITSKIGPEGI